MEWPSCVRIVEAGTDSRQNSLYLSTALFVYILVNDVCKSGGADVLRFGIIKGFLRLVYILGQFWDISIHIRCLEILSDISGTSRLVTPSWTTIN